MEAVFTASDDAVEEWGVYFLACRHLARRVLLEQPEDPLDDKLFELINIAKQANDRISLSMSALLSKYKLVGGTAP